MCCRLWLLTEWPLPPTLLPRCPPRRPVARRADREHGPVRPFCLQTGGCVWLRQCLSASPSATSEQDRSWFRVLILSRGDVAGAAHSHYRCSALISPVLSSVTLRQPVRSPPHGQLRKDGGVSLTGYDTMKRNVKRLSQDPLRRRGRGGTWGMPESRRVPRLTRLTAGGSGGTGAGCGRAGPEGEWFVRDGTPRRAVTGPDNGVGLFIKQ